MKYTNYNVNTYNNSLGLDCLKLVEYVYSNFNMVLSLKEVGIYGYY